jgi:DUF2075 family protein
MRARREPSAAARSKAPAPDSLPESDTGGHDLRHRAERRIKRAANSDELIRNVCKFLLTRGLRGCMIYSVDQETRQMLAGLSIPSLSASR